MSWMAALLVKSWFSCHPGQCKSSIAYSQALRLRPICSEPSDNFRHVQELEEHLVSRGHDRARMQKQLDRATKVKRLETLQSSRKKTEDRIPLAVTYHPQLPNVRNIITQHVPALDVSEKK